MNSAQIALSIALSAEMKLQGMKFAVERDADLPVIERRLHAVDRCVIWVPLAGRTMHHRISQIVSPIFAGASYPGHMAGMHGATTRKSSSRRMPRIPATPAWYIQAADPVYQLQPPRPACGATEWTSAART